MEKAVRSLSFQGSMRQESELTLNELKQKNLPLMSDEKKPSPRATLYRKNLLTVQVRSYHGPILPFSVFSLWHKKDVRRNY